MPTPFKKIGIMGRPRGNDSVETLETLQKFFAADLSNVLIDEDIASILPKCKFKVAPKETVAKESDLITVVGGDGSLLVATHSVINFQTPIVGINRGRLGFLTDIRPNEILSKYKDILTGKYWEEQRFLISAVKIENETQVPLGYALNDVVLSPGEIAHMIEFNVYIDGQFLCNHRADGLIITTPTGSTAYALSGGGPILAPQLDAIALVPMFPHTLSSRPIVVSGNSEIKITVSDSNESAPNISCDGLNREPLAPGSEIIINKKAQRLRLVHPMDYDYYETLRSKLYWEAKP